MSLTVENMSFSYGKHPVLHELTFTAEAGELLAILGPNGVGKTTLFKCVMGQERKYSGRIAADGADLAALTPRERAHRVAAIPQAHPLSFRYSAFDMVLMGTSHTLSPAYGEVRVIGEGADAVDLALINLCHAGDIVVSQDYGVAALALGKKCYCIHQSGRWYTDDNIDTLLMERHLAKKARRSARHHLKGPAKRTAQQNEAFISAFHELIQEAYDAAKEAKSQ